MSEFDDPQLERLLGGAGGAFPDVNTAYAQVTGRVRHIKRRRAMVATTAACVVLAAGAAFAIGRGDDRSNLSPAGGGDDTAVTETTDAATEPDSTAVTNGTGDSHPTESTDSSGSGAGTNSTSPSGSNTGSSGPSTSTNTTSPATPVNIGEQTYTCPGGTLKLKVVAGVMVLVSAQAADGFTLDSSTVEATRIEFRWRSATDDQRIRVDLDNGVLVRQS